MRAAALWLALLAAAIPAAQTRPQDRPSDRPRIEIVDAWARTAISSRDTTAFVTIVNRGDADDALVGVSSPIAERAAVQRVRHRGLTSTNRDVPRVEVEAADVVRMRPGGYFISVTGLTQQLQPGQKLPLSLRFEKSGTLAVDAEVSNQKLGNRGR
ncbi:MAG: copper chaperone PCu(A)C [Rhodospirillaceae bacterium]|nr:copper chaperone PCu(A)C [Rhodospirillaceae bacterium]